MNRSTATFPPARERGAPAPAAPGREGEREERREETPAGRPGASNAARAPSLRRYLLRHPGVVRLAVIAVILLAWEIAARLFMDPMFISPPSRVFTSLGAVWQTNGVPGALRVTFFELAVAFAIAVVIGLALGLAIGLRPFARRSLMPIVLLVYGLPQITILPLFILFFGIGPPSKIAFGVTHGVFPIAITVVAGVQNLKPILLRSARSMGASRWHIFRYVIFPHMIPSFFAGMRLGMSGVLLGVLLAELYVSTAGIGYFTTMFTENFDPTRLFGLIAMLAAMAILLNEIVRRAENRFSRWR
jgi:NitT/TauT family transport system permease protein